jgi:glycosyltransferase involved in cell wall biosynthesis
MFTNTYLPHVGGVARSVATFADDLRRRGHEVLVVAPTFPGLARADEDPAQVVRVPAIQNFNGSDFSVRLLLPAQFSGRLDAFGPELIHSHHPFLLGDAALRTARHRRLPIVFTHHTLYERYTHYVPFDSPLMQRFVIELASRFANLCRRVVAPSESIAELLRKRGVTTPCRVVPTGVDTEYFGRGRGRGRRFRDQMRIPPTAFVLGHLGRLAPEKNLAFLTEAAIRACRALPDGVFLVAGTGKSKDRIRTDFADAGLAERLVTAGQLEGEDLADCYAAMNLFIFTSTSETQGMVLTEAMAAGIPVIALDAPGAREVVRDRSNGRLLAPTAATEEFAAAIAAAAADPEGLAAWREQALRTAQQFSRQACAKRLEEVYLEALPAPQKNSPATLDAWEAIQESLHAEWELVASKLGAVIEAVGHPTGKSGNLK